MSLAGTVGWNVADEYQHKSPDEIQKLYMDKARPYAVGIINLAGDINVGTIMRTSFSYLCGQFYVLGRRSYDRRSSVGLQNYIPCERIHAMKGVHNDELDTEKLIQELELLREKYQLCFVEEKGVSFRQMKGMLTQKKPPLFLFGNETTGIPAQVLQAFPDCPVFSIFPPGIGRSLNVAVSAGIVLEHYHYLSTEDESPVSHMYGEHTGRAGSSDIDH